jgi:hypothetical protein
VQVAALAGMIGNPVPGIEFETAGDAHDEPRQTGAGLYIPRFRAGRQAVRK